MKISKIKINALAISVFSSAFLLASFSTAHAALYRWVDATGKVYFSDKVPPSIAQKGHTELAINGIETKKVLSAEELQQINEEKEKLAQQEKLQQKELEEEKRIIEEQKKHDKFLLSTFDTQQELIRYYEDKFTLLSGTANILKARNESLKKKIHKYKKQQSARKTKPVDGAKDPLQSKINSIETSLAQYQKALLENEQETLRLKKQYKKDLTRFSDIVMK